VSLPVLYVIPVLLGLWTPRPGMALGLASVATLLTLLRLFAAHGPAAPASIVFANRALAIATIWIIAVLVHRTKKANVSLHRSLRELEDQRAALDQAAIVARTDHRGIIEFVNDKFCEISKYRREELIGQDHRILNSGLHPKEFMRNLWTTIARGGVWRGEIRNRAKDGSFYWVDTTIVPFLNEGGKPYQYLAIRADITQRKLQEEELRRAESLARLGEMAAVVAHEVKNPLAAIGGVLQVVGERLPAGPDREILGEALERLKALNELLQELLVFARPQAPKLARVEIAPLVRQTVDLLRKDPAMKRVEVGVTGDEPALVGDADQLRRLFLNLLLNGAQAIGRKGRLDVTVAAHGGLCEVSVADHGPGIPADIRARIFEPFFTTKNRGTGLGLAIAARVLEAHRGAIRAAETPGGGATLVVTLPLPGEVSPEGGEKSAPRVAPA